MAAKEKPFLRFIPRESLWHPLVKFLAIPVTTVIAVALMADMVIMPEITRHGEEFPLPDVTGMSITDARTAFAGVGIGIEIAGEEPTPDLPEGTVLAQTPSSGSMVKKGRRVKLIISAGQEMVSVPAMVGFSQRQAELRLREAGLKTGTFNWAVDDSMQFANVLVYSVPSEGSLVPKGTRINLFFSRGAQANVVFVPQLLGLNLDDAQYVADSVGLNISKIDFAVNLVLLPNTVMWQSAPPGSKVEIGSPIELKVSVTD
jgi:serine/threonine-protein kinase